MKKLIFLSLLVIILAAIVAAGILMFQKSKGGKEEVVAVSSFEECTAKNYTILETYPRQCKTPDGKTFTEDIGNTIEKQDLIQLTNPRPNELIKSPLEISGTARGTWFFEASFPIILLDANNKEIGLGIAQTKDEWMTTDFISFEAKVEFQQPATKKGTLILRKDNPSGRPDLDDELKIPVVFAK